MSVYITQKYIFDVQPPTVVDDLYQFKDFPNLETCNYPQWSGRRCLKVNIL